MKNKSFKSEKEKLISIIRLAAIVAITFSILGVATFIIWQDYFSSVLDIELFKLSYQFLLIVVIGGGVSFLFSVYIKLREEIKQENETAETKKNERMALQRKFHIDFIQAYNSIKKIRRLLRARARIKSSDNGNIIMIVIKRYDEQLQALITLQLQFEFFREEIGSNEDLFNVDDKAKFILSIETVESYLNKIVSEYEECYQAFPDKSFSDDGQILRVEKLERLNDFIGKAYDAPEFNNEFKMPAKYVIESMKRLLTSS